MQAGQVIAVIELPEIDQQYNAAVTDLEHKRRNLARSQELLAKGNTTQVAMLQFETDARVAESNVKGLETMKGYQTIRAPFAGPGDGALCRSRRADHQRADQLSSARCRS